MRIDELTPFSNHVHVYVRLNDEQRAELDALAAKARQRQRHLDRISRPRCPRSPRWRAGTKHTARRMLDSDGGTLAVRAAPLDLSACVSIYDGGTNNQVPSGPRRAASKAYRAARAARAVRKDGAR